MQQSIVTQGTLEEDFKNPDYTRVMLKVFNKYGDIEEECYAELALAALHYTIQKYDPAKHTKFTSLLYRNMTNQCGMKRRQLRSRCNQMFERYEEDVEQKECVISKDVRGILDELPKEQKGFLCLKYFSEMNDDEVQSALKLEDQDYILLKVMSERNFRRKYLGEGEDIYG